MPCRGAAGTCGAGAVNRIILRSVDHELLGQRVRDQATGRIGKLGAVFRHVNAFTGRIVRDEAHLRPVDASGWEWTTSVADLARVDVDGGPENARRDG